MGAEVSERIGPRAGVVRVATDPPGDLLAEVLGIPAQPVAGAVEPVPGRSGIDPHRLRKLVDVRVLDRALDEAPELIRERTEGLLEAPVLRVHVRHLVMIVLGREGRVGGNPYDARACRFCNSSSRTSTAGSAR